VAFIRERWLRRKRRASEAQSEEGEFAKERRALGPQNTGGTIPGDVMDFRFGGARRPAWNRPPPAGVPKWKRAVEMQDGLAYESRPRGSTPCAKSRGAASCSRRCGRRGRRVARGAGGSPTERTDVFGFVESLKAQNQGRCGAWVSGTFSGVTGRGSAPADEDVSLRRDERLGGARCSEQAASSDSFKQGVFSGELKEW